MFSLSKFVKDGFFKAVGHMADYQIILNAAGWLEKGVLTESDLADIQTAIENKNFTDEITNIETLPEEDYIIEDEVLADG